MPGRPLRATLIAVALALPLAAAAEEPASDAAQVRIEFVGGYLKMQEDGDTVYWIASPSVTITRGDLRIFADNIVIWSKKGAGAPMDPKFNFEEFYAEGHLRMESGDQVLEGEQAYVNFRDGTILFTKGRLLSRSKKRGLPLTLSAEEFRKAGAGDMVASDVEVTTCRFVVPDYRLSVREIVIHENWRSGDIDLYGLTVELSPYHIPVFWLPWVPVQFGSQLPLRHISYANSRQFGNTVRTKWGLDIPKSRRDDAGNVLLDEHGEPDVDTWGSVGLDLDYMSRRGVGWGPEYEYDWESYRGFADVYMIDDEGDLEDSQFTERLEKNRTDDRFRVRIFHRQDIWGPLSGDVELHRLSDRDFREEFFEKEFKEEKAPESYALLRFMQDNLGVTGLYRVRLNGFQDQVEYLPQFTQSLLTQPIWKGLSVTHHAQYANVRFRKDKDVPDADQERLNRFDVQETLSWPFALGPIRLLPWASGRYTYFDYDRREEDFVDRYAGAAGGRARVAAWKKFPLTSALLGLDGVRHIASAEIRYFQQWSSVASREIFQFDAVDQTDRFEEYALEIRNRFETRNPSTGEVYDALNFGIALEYYPRAHRDTRAPRAQNLLYPAHWIVLGPDEDGAYRSRHFSNIHLDLEASVRDIVSFETEIDINPEKRHLDEAHLEVRVKPADTLTVRLGQQYVEEVTNTVGAGFEWRVSDKWSLGGRSDYDFRGERSIEHRYFVRRYLHDFDIEVGFKYDEGRDEFSASLSVIPHGKKERRLQGP